MSEPLRLLVQLDAPFHNLEGNRSVITIVTEGEKPPEFMGFRFEGEGPVHDQVAIRMIQVMKFLLRQRMLQELTFQVQKLQNKAMRLEKLK